MPLEYTSPKGGDREQRMARDMSTKSSTAPATDQVRTAVRFPMKLEIRLSTPDGYVDATTDNISANGILFSGAKLPAVNTEIEFTIKMPAAVMGTETDVSIHCLGRVVRHEEHGNESHAAAIIDEYFLRA